MAKKKAADTPLELTLDYQLAELPSSQHRAGLAGLVLAIQRMQKLDGVCGITRLDQHGLAVRLNRQGLEALFNEIYAASREEQERPQPLKNRNKEVVPTIRTETRQGIDRKTKKTKEKTIYVYEVVVPKGAFLTDLDPSSDGRNGLWIKLWRDVIWTIFRGVPATRRPFEDRASGRQPDDVAKVWGELIEAPDFSKDLPSTYFIGAQANNAENVPFKDRARFQFLLHFWPYVAQIYVPAIINNEDKLEFIGYALAVPDVADLKLFCEELPAVMRKRGTEGFGYRPRDCVVDLAIEGALDTFKRLRERLSELSGQLSISDLVLAIDVVHVEKQGNNIRLLGSMRVDPETTMIDEYARFRGSLWSPIFRRQRLLNLVNQRVWHAGFESLMSKLPYEQTIGNGYFRRDARKSFSNEVKTMIEQTNGSVETTEADDLSVAEDATEEALIYRVVSKYLRFKLDSKYKLVWKNVQGKSKEEGEYREMKAKLAREAFLAIRSRTGQDFVDYFASTLCSVSQSMNEQRFLALTKALVENTDEVRTLTMLALAAQTPNLQKSGAQS